MLDRWPARNPFTQTHGSLTGSHLVLESRLHPRSEATCAPGSIPGDCARHCNSSSPGRGGL